VKSNQSLITTETGVTSPLQFSINRSHEKQCELNVVGERITPSHSLTSGLVPECRPSMCDEWH
jgi:hypothetical protein